MAWADHWVVIELPVAGVRNGSSRGGEQQPIGFGDGVRDADVLDGKRAKSKPLAERYLDPGCICEASAREFEPRECRSESCRINGAVQPWLQIGECTQMVLVAMCEQDTGEPLAALVDKSRVGHHHRKIGKVVTTKSDADIHRDPGAVVTVQRHIHPDLTGTAKC